MQIRNEAKFLLAEANRRGEALRQQKPQPEIVTNDTRKTHTEQSPTSVLQPVTEPPNKLPSVEHGMLTRKKKSKDTKGEQPAN
jgi:hypothetical protein